MSPSRTPRCSSPVTATSSVEPTSPAGECTSDRRTRDRRAVRAAHITIQTTDTRTTAPATPDHDPFDRRQRLTLHRRPRNPAATVFTGAGPPPRPPRSGPKSPSTRPALFVARDRHLERRTHIRRRRVYVLDVAPEIGEQFAPLESHRRPLIRERRRRLARPRSIRRRQRSDPAPPTPRSSAATVFTGAAR